MTATRQGGKLLKVVFFDGEGEPVAKSTTQLPEDTFENRMGNGLVAPPFSLEQLVHLSEVHPLHSAAIDQKAADVIGTHWEWERTREDATEEEKDELEVWLSSLVDEDEVTLHEVLTQLWSDVETTNVGYLEVGRDPQGVARQIYYVPAHTVRFHKSGVKLAQANRADTSRVWFARWGALKEGEYVNGKTGRLHTSVPESERANDLLVVRRPSRRNSLYGVPGYISTVGWIALAVAVRDDNLYFFSNRREPRWAVIMTGLDDDPNLAEDLRQALAVEARQPHRNILIPLTGEADVQFKQLSDLKSSEGSFEKLEARCDAKVLVAHRIPPERLGMVRVGPLGGNVALASSRIYREAVISTSQTLLAARVNRFIQVEYRKFKGLDEAADLGWLWRPVELDLSEEKEDIEAAATLFDKDVVTLDEARARIGLDPLTREPEELEPNEEVDPRGAMLRTELKAHFGASIATEDDQPTRDPLADRLSEIDEAIRELLHPDDDDDLVPPPAAD